MRVLAFGCGFGWWRWERRQTGHGEQELVRGSVLPSAVWQLCRRVSRKRSGRWLEQIAEMTLKIKQYDGQIQQLGHAQSAGQST
jgi:hypothetical protein